MKREQPPVNIAEAPEKSLDRSAANLENSDPRGGISVEQADKEEILKREEADAVAAEAVRGKLQGMPEAKPEPAVISYSAIESQIANLGKEIEASKAQGFFKRIGDSWNRGVKADTIELLEKGLRMIKANPARQGEYMKALEQGGADLAMEYVEEAAKGNWRNVEDGKLVNISGRNSTPDILNQG